MDHSATGLIGVIAALELERATARPLQEAGCRLVCSGVGDAAGEAAEALLAAGCSRLLVWGMAGGLVAALRPGMLVLPSAVHMPDGTSYAADRAWHASVRSRLSSFTAIEDGAVVTHRSPLASRAEKQACAARTGAVAVDLESGFVARAAAERDVPFLVLRAVADPVENDVPPAAIDALGSRFLGLAVALRVLADPRNLPGVLRMHRAYRPARRALQRAAHAIADGRRLPQ